jgi:hypothetical protein
MDTWLYLTRHLEPNEEVMVVSYGPFQLQLTAPAIPVVQVQGSARRSLLAAGAAGCDGGQQQRHAARDAEEAGRACERVAGAHC